MDQITGLTDGVVAFTKVRLPWGWLGNMSPFPITESNKTWPTVEHLFQAMRFRGTAGEFCALLQEEIRSKKSPLDAKSFARVNSAHMTIKPRSVHDIANMRRVLDLKIKQHPKLLEKLLNTGTLPIVEDVTKRDVQARFWGAALASSGKWEGENILGVLWMAIREDARCSRI